MKECSTISNLFNETKSGSNDITTVLVLPEYWGTGVSLMHFSEMLKCAQAKGYTWADLSHTSQDHPRTPALAEHMGVNMYKRYRVYQKPVED
jgi:GNAT superfamily N-acetyltransferase